MIKSIFALVALARLSVLSFASSVVDHIATVPRSPLASLRAGVA
ncbi:hypothetical protein [Sphingobium sp.]|nr:hypothetical protein [Sphingobium sp.]